MHERGPHGAERLFLADARDQGGEIPNNPRLPVLVHRGALPPGDPAAAEAIFARHNWLPAWRNGIFAIDHYHPNAHEALAIAHGRVRVRLGAEAGVTLDLAAGDVVVLPAGTAHRNLGQSEDLLVVGAYPPGDPPEQFTGRPGERERALHAIAATPYPPCDPVTGHPYR
ncbi:cupin domain-containing protein [Falsiroseomonas selenitidurans]|uniref:Cupin domain-containing protein n=1 Tax=Falsiroseomonas selenitidurans TaxID=2716335 RepID=A0ABX1DWF1_9PROT|nr:cupin domain-containing protein [Falsiroseomonas selenitidurans]NKC29226.1 cupin domain-containing protein [Falsiroseomonas selenitidurans]